ncbi:MAG: AsmA-like C-terminal region-containing protein [Pseudomonadota bacterium]
MRLPAWVTDEIAARVNGNAEAPAVRFGDIEVRFEEGQPRVVLRDVGMRDASGATLGVLNEVRARLETGALARGQVVPTELRVSGAQMTVRRAADGTLSLNLGGNSSTEGSLASVLDAIDRSFQSDPLSSVERIEVDDLTLTLEDARSGRVWQATGGTLRLVNLADTVSITIFAEVFNGTVDLAAVQLSFQSTKADAGASVGVTMEEVPARDIAAQAPGLAFLGVLDAPISGAMRTIVDDRGRIGRTAATLTVGSGALQPTEAARPIGFEAARIAFTFDPVDRRVNFDELTLQTDLVRATGGGHAYLAEIETGWPQFMVGQVAFTELTLSPEGMFESPAAFSEAKADLRLTLDPFTVEVGQLSISDGPRTYMATGLISADEDGWDTALDLNVDAVTPDDVYPLWPVDLVPETRTWLERNVLSGTLTDVEAAVRLGSDTAPRIGVSFGFEDAEVRFLNRMPPIVGGRGHATIFDDRLDLMVEAGTVRPAAGGPIDITGSSFSIPDLKPKVPDSEIGIAATGTLEAALTLLSNPPFEVLDKINEPADMASAEAVVTAEIRLPLAENLLLEDVDLRVDGTLNNVFTDTLIPNRALEADAFAVAVTQEGISVRGPGTLDGLPFEAVWTQSFSAEAGGASTVSGIVELSQSFLDTFGIDLPPGTVGGQGSGAFEILLPPTAPPEITVSSDLAGMTMSVAPLGWRKGASTTGSLEVAGRLSEIPEIDSISLEAPGFFAEGTVTLGEGAVLQSADFTEVRAGNWFRSQVRITGRGAGAPVDVDLIGGRIDLAEAPTGGGGGSASGRPIDIALDELRITDTIALRPFEARVAPGQGFNGTFQGRVNGQAPIEGSVAPSPNGTAIRAIGRDAGAIFRSSGIFRSLESGSFEMILRPRAGDGYDGRLEIEDTRLRDQPAIAALLDAISVVGILDQLNGPGIFFDTVDADFQILPGRIVVNRSAAVGGSLGLSLDGYYDLARDQLDMQGVISPIYLLNGIGQIFTRRGEGLFGFSFRMTGSAEAPRLAVNPLSILTPGMFREIFRRPPPDPS